MAVTSRFHHYGLASQHAMTTKSTYRHLFIVWRPMGTGALTAVRRSKTSSYVLSLTFWLVSSSERHRQRALRSAGFNCNLKVQSRFSRESPGSETTTTNGLAGVWAIIGQGHSVLPQWIHGLIYTQCPSCLLTVQRPILYYILYQPVSYIFYQRIGLRFTETVGDILSNTPTPARTGALNLHTSPITSTRVPFCLDVFRVTAKQKRCISVLGIKKAYTGADPGSLAPRIRHWYSQTIIAMSRPTLGF